MKRKGFVLVTTLGVIAILTIAGTLATYTITNRTKGTVATKDSLTALKVAESGAEVALAKLKSGEIDCSGATCSPNTVTGTVGSGRNYAVTISKNGTIVGLISTGTFKNAQRKVVINIQSGSGGTYYPFAINGTFSVTGTWDTAGYGGGSGSGGKGKGGNTEWTEAEMGVVNIDDDLKERLEDRSAFTVNVTSTLDVPKVAEMTPYINSIKTALCSSSDLSTDKIVNSSDFVPATLNGENVKVVCGKNITVNSLSLDNTPTYIISSEDTIISGAISSSSSELNLSIIADDTITTSSGGRISDNGNLDLANILLYAGEEISDTSSSPLISFTGKNTDNIVIATPGTINISSITNTGNTESNTIFWADKGINIDTIAETGGSMGTTRNYAIISDSNVTIDTTALANSVSEKSGLSYEEIKEYCETGKIAGQNIPETYKDFFCQLKNQIDGGSLTSNINITEWKVY